MNEKADKIDEETKAAVLRAFAEARSANHDAGSSYQAAIDAWCAIRPADSRSRAARYAVGIIHASFGSMQSFVREKPHAR
jgi:hypothetical protein